ncbi:transposase [Streptomyces sp. NRRL WC-3618]|uniref:RNA-guided endonuclease InsQ/TnpB family protein n=1 Tax=Streptomyces sp. NRRL WC-3618 TaxID=1519490 RepID=UPI0006C18316|nr:RNA-guided endonuclease TnpB family protein [Streptomyces sp. NRRL WC-3618]KOV85805.1 transposase [Streptomyces sp. NRRL WC-3618]
MEQQESQQGLVKRQFGHRARLALDPAQVAVLDAQGHAGRTTWNLLHDWWLMLPKAKRTLAAADAVIRQGRRELDWLGVLPAQAAQAVLKTYFQAWKNCWEGRAQAPEFKGRFRTRMSIDIPQGRDLHVVRVHRRWGMVNIPKLGRVRFRWTKDLPVGKGADKDNRITGARLVKDALGWHIAFRVQALTEAPTEHPGPEVGIDAGITVPLALSDGETAHHGPWLSKREEARLLHYEQRAARRKSHRKKGERTSRRLSKTYDRIARIRATAKRRREDWQHKTTTVLADTYGTVVVEALHITNMTKSAKGTVEQPGRQVAQKAGLNRAILGEAWGRTVHLLASKLARRGGLLAEVPAPGTSQECSQCHTVTPGSRRNQAEFLCNNPACGWQGNADTNAARTVLHRYRTGHALVPAAGRAVVRRASNGVKPATAR